MNKLPIYTDSDIPEFTHIIDVHHTLHYRGCRRCNLGFQPDLNGCCVSRGRFDSKYMIIGEAPGKYEDANGQPFSGPAGQKMDEIFTSVGLVTNDFYVTNVTKCRPIMSSLSGKENYTPKSEQLNTCKIYWQKEIELIKPKLIIAIGATATKQLLEISSFSMAEDRGKVYTHTATWNTNIIYDVFPMIHPAALLHSYSKPYLYNEYRKYMWDDINKLRGIIDAQ